MDVLSAIILGFIQGVTEFIPVSSTGHMILARQLFDLDSTYKFEVLLNIGTLVALVVYYRHTIQALFKDVFIAKNHRMASLLVFATLPAILIGFFFGDTIERNLQSTWVLVFMLILVGVPMILMRAKRKLNIKKLTTKNGLLVGLAQAVALIPGTSRSGITILAGQAVGLSAKEAARFSFMLAIPTIFGAILKTALTDEGRSYFANHLDMIILGNLVSFASGFLAVAFLIEILGRNGLKPFGWYRLGLSGLLIVLIFAKIV